MHGVILREPGRLESIETEPPGPPAPGEVVVRVDRVGICGTDMGAFRGRQPFFSYPRILGHELGVIVDELGEGVQGMKVGDRCSVEPYMNCGHCRACRQGRTNCCASLECLGVHCDGGMRERILLPATKLHRSEMLTTEQLALVFYWQLMHVFFSSGLNYICMLLSVWQLSSKCIILFLFCLL